MGRFSKVFGLVTARRIALVACLVPVVAMAQGPTWTSSKIEKYNGYDYELWNQNNAGTVSMKLTGDNGSGTNAVGGTFTAEWRNTQNVLFRSGRKWGSNSNQNHTQIGNMTIDFAATWSSTDNVKMLGVYGWAYFTSANVPTKQENGTNASFSNQIEYYIIQDRGSYNPASGGTNAKKYGSATIDGIAYDFYVCDRINQPMLTGNGNFKQFFSVPQSTSAHRQSGKISVSEHFKKWHDLGMKMDGPLYEVAMKVESYTGSGNSNGSATVTKNLLCIGSGCGSSGGGDPPVTPPVTPPADGNLVTDGNFSGTSLSSSWSLNTGADYGGSAATASVSNGNATINVTTTGGQPYYPQLTQTGISLEQGKSYRLTFDARAASARTMGVVLEMSEDPWTGYTSKNDISLTTSNQTITHEFTMTGATTTNAQLAFNVGQSTGSVTISNVKLVKIDGLTSISHRNPAASRIGPPLVSVSARTLKVNASSDSKVRISVVDMRGKTVARFNAQGGSAISLKKIPAGSYVIEAKRVKDGVKTTSAVVLK